MLIPLLCGGAINDIASYTGTESIPIVDVQGLLANLSWFAIGMSLLIRPDFLTKIILVPLKAVDENNPIHTSLLRILGAVLVTGSSFSSRFLILELLKNVQH